MPTAAQSNARTETRAANPGRVIANGVIRDLLRAAFHANVAAFHANVIVLASAAFDTVNENNCWRANVMAAKLCAVHEILKNHTHTRQISYRQVQHQTLVLHPVSPRVLR
jgi:hypothetical protein